MLWYMQYCAIIGRFPKQSLGTVQLGFCDYFFSQQTRNYRVEFMAPQKISFSSGLTGKIFSYMRKQDKPKHNMQHADIVNFESHMLTQGRADPSSFSFLQNIYCLSLVSDTSCQFNYHASFVNREDYGLSPPHITIVFKVKINPYVCVSVYSICQVVTGQNVIM